MIKNFHQISEKDLNYLVSNDYKIYEKLDMYYFRVEITHIGAIATKKSTGKCISDIDCITNSMYKEICDFVETYINPHCTEFIEKYNTDTLGFFYLPIERYHKIKYNHGLVHRFIYSDSSNNLSYNDIAPIFNFNLNICSHEPRIATVTHSGIRSFNKGVNSSIDPQIIYAPDIDFYKEYLEGKMTDVEFIKSLCGKTKSFTYSSNEINDIEGIIIRNDKFQYQVIVNNVEDDIDKSTKKIYRDTLIKSIIDDFMKDETAMEIASSKKTYIEKISELFLLYMNNTDLFAKYSFDPEDLLPPTTGYIGDIDFDLINDNNVKLICKYNEVNKNIFRIFLYTFTKNISEDKFNFLTNITEKEYLNKLIIALNYKNYKEIMLNAYKAKH